MNDPTLTKSAALAAAGASVISSWLLADQWSMYILGVPVAVVLAAFGGAVLALSFLPPAPLGSGRWQIKVVAATLSAAFIEPLVGHWLGTPDKVQLGLAFALAAALQGLAHAEVRAWLVAQINRRLGGGGGA